MRRHGRPTDSTGGQRPMTQAESLLASECAHPDCNATPQGDFAFPVPLCRSHFVQVLARSVDIAQESSAKASVRQGSRQTTGAVIYYVRFADRIKIGTTTNLPKRLEAIPHDAVLAVERGGHALEHLRHLEFAADRITGEWFRPSPRLLQHIEKIKQSGVSFSA